MALKFMFAANRRMKSYADKLRANLEHLKCDYVAVDLGGLGYGVENIIKDDTFQTLGYYRTQYHPHPARSIHKPKVVEMVLEKHVAEGQVLVYLDADCELRADLNEIETMPFDVGITVGAGTPNHPRETWLNAGVIFFRKNEASRGFIKRWEMENQSTGSDQHGLQYTVDSEAGERIMEFPMEVYNYRFFPEDPLPDGTVKIVHYMASVRDPALKRIWQLRAKQG